MTFWEFHCAATGYAEANSSEEDKSLSTKETEDLAAWLGI